MHIAFFIYSLSGGGAERVTTHMAEYWAKKNHKITVITMSSAEGNRYKLSNCIDLKILNIDGESKGLLPSVTNNIKRIKVIRQTIIEVKPAVIISMMAPANVLAGLACVGLSTCCIGSERNYPGFDYSSRMWNFLRKYTYRNLNAVVTQTEVGKQWITQNTNAKCVHSIPNPIILPLPSFEPIVSPSKIKGKHLIIGTGRLTKQKQFHHLIEAFAGVAKDFDNWDLTIIGEGEKHIELEETAKDFGVSSRVHLPGRVGNVSDWYDSADLFVMTSQTEGFPNALIEAMAHGVAVISYDCLTGPAEIIDSGTNGLLVEKDDIKELETQIRHLIGNPSTRKRLAQGGKGIISKLDSGRIMEKWEIVLSKACN